MQVRALINRALHARATNIRITTGVNTLVVEDDGAAEADPEGVLRNIDRGTPIARRRPMRHTLIGRNMWIASRKATNLGWTSLLTTGQLLDRAPARVERALSQGTPGTGIVINLLGGESRNVEQVARRVAENYRSRITVDGCRIPGDGSRTAHHQAHAA